MRSFNWVLLLSLSIISTVLNARANEIVTVDTTKLVGQVAQLALDFTGGPDANAMTVSGFSTDGVLSSSSRTGEASGTLPGAVILTAALPADFFNEYLANITLGTSLSFVLSATTIGPPSGSFPDAFSVFILDPTDGLSLVATTDPTGSQSLLTLTIDGSPSGDLNVYRSNTVGVTATATTTSSVAEPNNSLLAAGLSILLTCAGRRRICELISHRRMES